MNLLSHKIIKSTVFDIYDEFCLNEITVDLLVYMLRKRWSHSGCHAGLFETGHNVEHVCIESLPQRNGSGLEINIKKT